MNLPSRFLDELPEHLMERAGSLTSAASIGNTPRSLQEASSRFQGDPEWDEFDQRPAEEQGGLRLGMHVRHPQFGLGVVRKKEGQGEQQKVMVAFENGRIKTLLVRYAHLTLVN